MRSGSPNSSPATDASTCCCSTNSVTSNSIPAALNCSFRSSPSAKSEPLIATASNLPFSEWGKVITDARLVAAIIDRLTFNAHIIETGSGSYRLKSTQARPAKTRSLLETSVDLGQVEARKAQTVAPLHVVLVLFVARIG